MTNTFDGSTPYAPQQQNTPAPLVDEALAATDRSTGDRAELDALRAEVARLKESARETAAGAGRVAGEEISNRIAAEPLKAAAAVAVLGFLYGLTR